jgi:hypothetical protein
MGFVPPPFPITEEHFHKNCKILAKKLEVKWQNLTPEMIRKNLDVIDPPLYRWHKYNRFQENMMVVCLVAFIIMLVVMGYAYFVFKS